MKEVPQKPESVAHQRGDLDEFYLDVWGEHLHHGLWLSGKESPEIATRNLIDLAIQKVGIAPGAKVVDVGCGYGGTSQILAADFGCQVTGYTQSAKQYKIAMTRKSHPQIGYRLEDWLTNDLDDESQDALLAIESTEHIPSLERCLKQMSRVLKPGKRAVICAWLTSEEASPRARKLFIDPICREGRLHAYRTATDFVRTGHQFGLKVSDVDDFSRTVKKSWRVGATRVAKGLLTKPSYRALFTSDHHESRLLAQTLLRIITAYELGVMQYGMITFIKSSS